jgi:hypothetical protein
MCWEQAERAWRGAALTTHSLSSAPLSGSTPACSPTCVPAGLFACLPTHLQMHVVYSKHRSLQIRPGADRSKDYMPPTIAPPPVAPPMGMGGIGAPPPGSYMPPGAYGFARPAPPPLGMAMGAMGGLPQAVPAGMAAAYGRPPPPGGAPPRARPPPPQVGGPPPPYGAPPPPRFDPHFQATGESAGKASLAGALSCVPCCLQHLHCSVSLPVLLAGHLKVQCLLI